ncbi:Polysaccharide biosynthesis protein [Candidatus Methylomirabilis lanthanidiphila]|uniref:Polysaccharide biosynthesis protein n=1 Tax=Candidatus Methylomirabilis lanthanidiphila TaxID=2211376 RepID=A0A564ZJQ0_9BACT|nr:oligosaccharide flippase family protein [Candidatus Methylomirabilis lanthanidiphila]VUZ84862.1 Polysaccharide biosynthesis protein [Candidatus Methylomirabilis lanthanidiphila]
MTTPHTEIKSSRIGQLLSGSGLYMFGNVVRRSFSLITMPLFTRYLSTSGYGILSIVGVVQHMLEVFYEMGMGSASTRFYYDCREERERKVLFGTLLLLSLGATLVLTLLLLATGEWLWGVVGKDIPFFPYIVLTIGTVFLGNITVLAYALFRVENQAARFLRLSLIQTILTVLLAVLFVVWLGLGPLGPVLATFIITMAFFGVYGYALRGHVNLVFRWLLAGQALAFGLPEIPLRWGNWALKVADRLILQHLTSLSVVAIYSVGYSVSKIPFDMVVKAIDWALVPFFYATATKESEGRSKAIFSRIATYNVAMIAGLGLGTVLFGRELIEILASAKYAEAEAVVPIIVAASFLQALFDIPSKGIYLQRKTGYLLPLFTIPAALNIGLNFVLIPRFGMMGAAWATLVCYAVMIVLTLTISQRIYYIPYEYVRISKVILGACMLATFGSLASEVPFLTRIAVKTTLLMAFPLGLYVIGFFEDTEIGWVRDRITGLVQEWAGSSR